MSRPRSTRKNPLIETGVRPARLVAAAVRAGRRSTDAAFDRFLPDALREVSDHYWTPLPVIRRVALWLRETGVRSVVDVGSGAGKFTVAAALLTRCRFVGVEHRAGLIEAAESLAAAFEVSERVSFVHGGIEAAAQLRCDAYYLFNPFGRYWFDEPEYDEPSLTFAPDVRDEHLAAVGAMLAAAPKGTFVITYNGFGASLPGSYQEIDTARQLPGTLRLWKQVRR